MSIKKSDDRYDDIIEELKIRCEDCSGLCCVALYCMKSDGFPANKAAGVPCKHLMPDFRCNMHSRLAEKNMKGCLSYDCFGAGQKVTQLCYPDKNWQSHPEKADEIFQVFIKVYRLHQMAWYLLESLSLTLDEKLIAEIHQLIELNQRMTWEPPEKILTSDMDGYKARVNDVLKQVSSNVKTRHQGKDYSMKMMLGATLNGAKLNKSNFLGTDIRDANLRNADLSDCIFLTQMQINSAKGNSGTKLPDRLTRPPFWE